MCMTLDYEITGLFIQEVVQSHRFLETLWQEVPRDPAPHSLLLAGDDASAGELIARVLPQWSVGALQYLLTDVRVIPSARRHVMVITLWWHLQSYTQCRIGECCSRNGIPSQPPPHQNLYFATASHFLWIQYCYCPLPHQPHTSRGPQEQLCCLPLTVWNVLLPAALVDALVKELSGFLWIAGVVVQTPWENIQIDVQCTK